MLKVTLAPNPGGAINRLDVLLQNDGAERVRLLYWGTPLDPVAANFLDVFTDDGDPVAFVGPRGKYLFDPEASLETLEPGETRTVSIDLAERYDLPHSGRYRVVVRDAAFRGLTGDRPRGQDAIEALEIRSDPASIALAYVPPPTDAPTYRDEGELESAALDDACPPLIFCVPPAYRDAGYECRSGYYITYPKLQYMSEAQAKTVRRLQTELFWRLRGFSVGNSPIFVRWFGRYSEASRQTVQAVVSGIRGQTACKGYTISYIASPPKPDIVAVFMKHNASSASPWDSMGVYPLFFRAPDFGLDSKIGTLAHELSHGYGGTKDHMYFYERCKALAISDPAKAMANADSYQFYLEEMLLMKPLAEADDAAVAAPA